MRSIGRIEPGVRQKVRESLLDAVREVLPDELIRKLCAEELRGMRERVLVPIAMLWYWVAAALNRERAFAGVWADFWMPVAMHYPAVAGWRPQETGVLARARLRIKEELLAKLNAEVVRQAEAEAGAWGQWKELRLALLDGSTVSLEDRPELEAAFGKPKNQHGTGPYPTLRCVNLVRGATGIILGSAWDHHLVSEQELTERLLALLTPKDLLLGDRNFAGWRLMAQLQVRHVPFLLRKEAHLDIRNYPHKKIGPNEWLVDLPKPERFQQTDPDLPAVLRVRVIKRRVGRKQARFDLWLVTNLLDPVRYPADELVELYGKRWGVEQHFRELKRDLHLDVLRSTTVAGVQREMRAHHLAYNLVRLMILRAAKQEGVDLERISFVNAVRTIWAFSGCMCLAPVHELRGIYRVMLTMIAANLNPSRPGRHEPRAVRRARKAYPMLRKTRAAWRKEDWEAA